MQSSLKSLIFLALAIGAVQARKYLDEQPSLLTPCATTDSGFNTCFAKNFQVLFREWKDGVPGLKTLSPLDPLIVKRVKIAQDAGPALSLHMDLKNLSITGISGLSVPEARLDKQKLTATIKFFVPKMDFDADLKSKGLLFGLNINGYGTTQFHTENTLCTGVMNLKVRQENGHNFIDITNYKIELNRIDKFHIVLKNLFGSKAIEDSANELFNDNWRDIYQLLRPAIEQTIASIFKDRFQKFFSYVPADYIISDLGQS